MGPCRKLLNLKSKKIESVMRPESSTVSITKFRFCLRQFLMCAIHLETSSDDPRAL